MDLSRLIDAAKVEPLELGADVLGLAAGHVDAETRDLVELREQRMRIDDDAVADLLLSGSTLDRGSVGGLPRSSRTGGHRLRQGMDFDNTLARHSPRPSRLYYELPHERTGSAHSGFNIERGAR